MAKTLVRFVAINRKTRTTKPCWVSGVRFKDGDGYRVKSISYTFDRTQAARFSTVAAMAIAEQYSSTPAVIELVDGTVLVNETAQVAAEQHRRNEKIQAARAQFRADWNEIFASMPADLKSSLLNALR